MNKTSTRAGHALLSADRRGFTLVEVLVVLVLLSMMMTLLMQGLTYVGGMRLRFLAQVERQQQGGLPSSWFRRVSSAMTPDHKRGQHLFSGDTRGFKGLTLAPLLGATGIPVPVYLFLEQQGENLRLMYQEYEDTPLELATWSASAGELRYLDDEGVWQGQWPLAEQGRQAQLPRAIMAQIRQAVGVQVWYGSIAGRRHPPTVLRDLN